MASAPDKPPRLPLYCVDVTNAILDWAALGEARIAMAVQIYLKEVDRFMIDIVC